MWKVKDLLQTYEHAVEAIAHGDAAVITDAGLVSREAGGVSLALDRVAEVHSAPGKLLGETIVTWSKGPGATSYAIEVNYNPHDPASPWVALKSGTKRRRAIKTPAPGAQILVRVASLDGSGTQSDWSDSILATAR